MICKTTDYTLSPSKYGKLKTANDGLIQILDSLHSEYPQASLHDCHESKEGSNPVMLGRTVLGTFNSE